MDKQAFSQLAKPSDEEALPLSQQIFREVITRHLHILRVNDSAKN